jgi:hypothetical protein
MQTLRDLDTDIASPGRVVIFAQHQFAARDAFRYAHNYQRIRSDDDGGRQLPEARHGPLGAGEAFSTDAEFPSRNRRGRGNL